MSTQSDNYKHYLNILLKNIKNITFIIHSFFDSETQVIFI